jgi:hypothetical protein
MGTWMLIGFFTAIGWGAADKAVVQPYVAPAIEKIQKSEIKTEEPKYVDENQSK